MGRIAAMAEAHWRKYLPEAMTMPDPAAFFRAMETEAETAIALLEDQIAGPELPGESTADRAGRLRMARFEAEASVLREMVLIAPEPETATLESAAGPQTPEDATIAEAMAEFAEARQALENSLAAPGPTTPGSPPRG